MKEWFRQFQFKPRDVQVLVDNEDMCSKARVIGFSALMLLCAGSMFSYYSDMTMRVGYFQNKAYAGEKGYEFADYIDQYSDNGWFAKNRKTWYENLSIKDLKYVKEGWMHHLDANGNAVGIQEGSDGGWYTQTDRYDAWYAAKNADFQKYELDEAGKVRKDADKYEEWVTMREDVVWFDTAACMNAPSRIGGINQIKMVGTWGQGPRRELEDAPNSMAVLGWWSGVDELARDNYKTDVAIIDGQIGYPEKFVGETDRPFFLAECDIDCQARGSGLSIVAILNMISLGIICMNAIIMFVGTWRYKWRTFSIFCTFAACLIQFIVIIVSATYLFSIYSIQICARALTDTAPGRPWTMSNDYYANVSLWIVQIVFMFVFLSCGLVSAFQFTHSLEHKKLGI